MTELSPQAHAVKRDLAQIMQELSKRCRVSISATDALPITLETNDASLQAGINSLCATALRAAVDQVVPEPSDAAKALFSLATVQILYVIRDDFLAIATELKNQ